ncbi:hypothetical protein AAFF_G00268050 [Aldrovandia affinis]|uniref:Cyclin-like domain-containing protein n=1 Tax=Aldrovandia affinis TaxID=143900 RepID=A0AAD7SSC5_9TELE|nr:hypothetical protein AAFF_G00268050 [Aldrovandia affinis]
MFPRVTRSQAMAEKTTLPVKHVASMPYSLRPREALRNANININNIGFRRIVTKKEAVPIQAAKCRKPQRVPNVAATKRAEKENNGALVYQADRDTALAVQPLACVKNEDQNIVQAFSETMLDIPDVDLDDADNALVCSEYVKDIYSYLRHVEGTQAVRPQYLEGREVTANMRALLIDWLVQVQKRFQLLQETLFMTVAILDRFLQDNPVPKNMLQLVGVTAMLIASKYEEVYPQ